MTRHAEGAPTPDQEAVHAEVRLLKNAVPADGGDVPFLLRLRGDLPERKTARTPVDLALVLDRSGSMSGAPLEAAKVAAHDAVDLLEDGDRIAIVTFGTDVEVVVPATRVDDRAALHEAVDRIAIRGSTALHAGWVEGAQQLVDHLDPARSARVVLLTDGLANVGVTDPGLIAADVAKMAGHGVATSTIGLGRAFAEDLLAAVADAGGGRFAHAETPAELEGVMAAELIGIDATVARQVRARLDARGVAAEVADVLNDLPVVDGELALPDLVAGLPLDVAGLLHVRPAEPGVHRALGTVQLAWTGAGGARRTAELEVAAPAWTAAAYDAAEADPDVAETVAVLTASRHRDAAMRALDRRDDRTVERELAAAERLLDGAPDTPRVQRERAALARAREALAARDDVLARKRFAAQRFQGRASFHPEALSLTAHYATKEDALRARRALRSEKDRGHDLEVPRPDGTTGTLRLIEGDVTEWRGDAIVNPTHPRMHGAGASVDGAVHRRGGMDLTRECRAIGHVALGEAVVTKGWNLPADYVLHTAVPAFDGTDGAYDVLRACYRSTLLLARQLRLTRIAYPAIGTGSNGFPVEPAAEIALRELLDALAAEGGPTQVDVVLYDAATLRAYRRVLGHLARERRAGVDAA